MRDAGLDRVDSRVANTRVAKHKGRRQVATKPIGHAVWRYLSHALRRLQPSVASEPLEPPTLEQEAAIQVAQGVERDLRRLTAKKIPLTIALSRHGSWKNVEAARSPEVVRLEGGLLSPQHHLNSP